MSFNVTSSQAAQGATYAGRAMNAFQTAVNIDNEQPQTEGTTFWFRWLIRVVAVVSGGLAMICGVFGALSTSPWCIIAGVLMILIGFGVIMFEVPICCQFVQYTAPVAQFSQQRPPWQKALLYSGPPLVPLLLCQSFSIILGFFCIVANAAIQFMLAVGKKAPIEEMLQRAGVGPQNNRGQPVPSGPSDNFPSASGGEKSYNFTPLQ